ncbi:MAG: TetR/AcrR family transcriptional regulator [Pirellulaceae bacterium]|jgi:AcrR family transcriptional regulator|nr:TetR/AcrR family transcriptional regulator [Pirellulaceae bacterium]
MAKRRQARPAEILQAAIEEFSENGFAGAKIEAIAARAGVAKGTVYLYYATKEELFEAIVRDRVSPVFKIVSGMVKLWPGSQTALLKQIIPRFYSEIVENDMRRMILKTLISESDRFEQLAKFYHKEILVPARKMLKNIVRNGIKNGEFRDAPIAIEPLVLVGPALTAAIWKMTFERAEKLDTKRWLDAHVDLVVHGLKKVN